MAQRPYEPEQNMLFLYTPDQALPADHVCYVLDEIVEKLDFRLLPDRTATPGAPQYDPRLMTKVLLYGYMTGIYSSRKLMIACREQLPFIYLTRGQAPDFRTISDFRKNHLEFLGGAYVQLVGVARQLGLAKLGMVAIDSMKVRANASQRKVLSKKRLGELRDEVMKHLREAVALDEREDAQLGRTRTGQELPEHLRAQARRLEQIDRALACLRETGYQKASLTDPESSQMRNHGRVRPHYSCQVTVDTENAIIVASDVSRSPTDYDELKPQLDQTASNTGATPKRVLADNGYYTSDNVAELERRGMEGYIPSGPQARDAKLRAKGKEVPERPFEKTKFRYDKEKDVYLCPLGRELVRRGNIRRDGSVTYRCPDCHDCPRKPECAPKKACRSITRNRHEPAVETMRRRMDSEQGRAIYQRRLPMERIFGYFKWAGGFHRFRLRGTRGALTEFRLLCIGHNIKQIIQYLKTLGADEAKQRLQEAVASCFAALQTIFLSCSTNYSIKFVPVGIP